MAIAQERVHPLRFVGQQSTPLGPQEVVQKRPVLGSGDRPAPLEELANSRRLYVRPPDGAQGAMLTPQATRAEGADGIWRVDVPLTPGSREGLPGHTAVRSRPAELLSEINPDIEFSGYRPEWCDQLYVPRLLPGIERAPLRRLNGRLMRPEVVFPPEERVEFADASYPWGTAGKMFASDGATGSAALVGPRTVVTAGHVVPWGDIASGSGWSMRFVPAYFNGQSLHGAGVESWVSDVRGYNPGSDTVGYDWAVCRLYEPLGNMVGYFGFNGYSPDWEDKPIWSIVGYPADVTGAERPTFQGGVAIFDDDSDSNGGLELEHRGDTGPGNSGGPMFAWWDSDPRVIGVHVGYEEDVIVFPPGTEPGNVTAGGPGFTNLIAWGRTNWP